MCMSMMPLVLPIADTPGTCILSSSSIPLCSMMGDGFEQRAAGFLLKKELTYFSKVRHPYLFTHLKPLTLP